MGIALKVKNTAAHYRTGAKMKVNEIISENISQASKDFLSKFGLNFGSSDSSASSSDSSDTGVTTPSTDASHGYTDVAGDTDLSTKSINTPNGGPIDIRKLPKSSPAQIDPKVIAKYLKTKGLDTNQVAGLVVSIKWESHFRPGVWIPSDAGQGPSGGFFGFHNVSKNGTGPFTNMIYACGGIDKWQTNWQGQLDFALSRGVGATYKTMKFDTPGKAAAWWVRNYEKPKDTEGQAIARAKDAGQYAYV
jgi:Phage tail lysozyme